MRVGASRPRQTSQGDDKEKNMTFEDAATIDNKTTNGKDGLFGSNNQKSQETDDEQQESRYKTITLKVIFIYLFFSIIELFQIVSLVRLYQAHSYRYVLNLSSDIYSFEIFLDSKSFSS